MAYNDNSRGGGGRFGGPKRMCSGDWTCMECKNSIPELPFNPPQDADDLLCRDCHRKQREKGFDVDLNCMECEAHITNLPFRPKDESSVLCKECHQKSRGNSRGGHGGGGGRDRAPRQMIQVEGISCKNCNTDITELPFEPNDPDNVLCRTCHMEQRKQF